MRSISRQQTRELIDNWDDLVVVETLEMQEFENFHLPRAIHVHYDEQFSERMTQLVPDKTTPVVVYCKSADCDASSKAAEELDQLGYESVFDYEAGKVDWRQAGMPIEV